MDRVIVFAHFDKNNLIQDYVVYYVAQLRKIAQQLIFVSTSALSTTEQSKIFHLVDQLICRENKGYDFHSYKTGIESVKNLEQYEQLVLCNDSCFGPFFPLDEIFNDMSQIDCSFWGMTSTKLIAQHVQSYFLVFNPLVHQSEIFKNFWQTLAFFTSRKEIVEKYEIKLSQILIQHGLSYATYIPEKIELPFKKIVSRYKDLCMKRYIFTSSLYDPSNDILLLRSTDKIDKTIIFWDELIKNYHMPFAKRNILSLGLCSLAEYKKVISDSSSYLVDQFIDFPHE